MKKAADRTFNHFHEIDWNAWEPVERATLLFVLRNGHILLIHKKRGLGAGKINGPGGRIDPGETPEACAVREVEEELLVTPTGVRKAGELRFQFTDGYSLHGHVFTADGCSGEPQETDEATPLWTPLDKIPYEKMWADDRIWLPLMLEGRPFSGRFLFDNDTMLGYSLETSNDCLARAETGFGLGQGKNGFTFFQPPDARALGGRPLEQFSAPLSPRERDGVRDL